MGAGRQKMVAVRSGPRGAKTGPLRVGEGRGGQQKSRWTPTGAMGVKWVVRAEAGASGRKMTSRALGPTLEVRAGRGWGRTGPSRADNVLAGTAFATA